MGLIFATSCFQGTHFFITKIFVRTFLFLFFCCCCCCYFQQKGQIKNKIQKQAPEMFCKEGVPRNFAKFKGKLLYQSLFSNKVAAATLLKKKLWHRCFPVNFPTFLRTPFLQNISGRLLLKIMLRSGPVPIFLMTTHLSQWSYEDIRHQIINQTFHLVLFLLEPESIIMDQISNFCKDFTSAKKLT